MKLSTIKSWKYNNINKELKTDSNRKKEKGIKQAYIYQIEKPFSKTKKNAGASNSCIFLFLQSKQLFFLCIKFLLGNTTAAIAIKERNITIYVFKEVFFYAILHGFYTDVITDFTPLM